MPEYVIFFFICGAAVLTIYLVDLIFRRGVKAGARLVLQEIQQAHFHIDILINQKSAMLEFKLITTKTKKEKSKPCKPTT